MCTAASAAVIFEQEYRAMQSQKQTVQNAPRSEHAPVGTGFGSIVTPAELWAIERKARRERALAVTAWISGGVARLINAIRAAHRRRVAIDELSALDNRMLADIGISRSEIRAAVASASGFVPRAVASSRVERYLNDDALTRAA
jgi:uncharacterized protein YjiS (DUF1127 family)